MCRDGAHWHRAKAQDPGPQHSQTPASPPPAGMAASFCSWPSTCAFLHRPGTHREWGSIRSAPPSHRRRTPRLLTTVRGPCKQGQVPGTPAVHRSWHCSNWRTLEHQTPLLPTGLLSGRAPWQCCCPHWHRCPPSLPPGLPAFQPQAVGCQGRWQLPQEPYPPQPQLGQTHSPERVARLSAYDSVPEQPDGGTPGLRCTVLPQTS